MNLPKHKAIFILVFLSVFNIVGFFISQSTMECYSIDLLLLASSEALVFSLVCYRSSAVTFLECLNTQIMLNFWNARGSRISNITFPCAMKGMKVMKVMKVISVCPPIQLVPKFRTKCFRVLWTPFFKLESSWERFLL